MGDYRLIDCTTRILIRLLATRLDAVLGSGSVVVQAATPAGFDSLAGSATPTVSLILYRIGQNPELRNAPLRRLPGGRTARQPLALELFYIVTAWGVRSDTSAPRDATASLEEQRLLGLVAQTFYDCAEISGADLVELVPGRVWHDGDSIQLMLEQADDTMRVWDAGENRYRLSLVYRARVLGIDSAESTSEAPVLEATLSVVRR